MDIQGRGATPAMDSGTREVTRWRITGRLFEVPEEATGRLGQHGGRLVVVEMAVTGQNGDFGTRQVRGELDRTPALLRIQFGSHEEDGH